MSIASSSLLDLASQAHRQRYSCLGDRTLASMESFRYDEADAALAESRRQGGAGALLPDWQGFRLDVSPSFLRKGHPDPNGSDRCRLAYRCDAHRLLYRRSSYASNLQDVNDIRSGKFYGIAGFGFACPRTGAGSCFLDGSRTRRLRNGVGIGLDAGHRTDQRDARAG